MTELASFDLPSLDPAALDELEATTLTTGMMIVRRPGHPLPGGASWCGPPL